MKNLEIWGNFQGYSGQDQKISSVKLEKIQGFSGVI